MFSLDGEIRDGRHHMQNRCWRTRPALPSWCARWSPTFCSLGCSIMPFRLGVPPEIVLVTLGAVRPAVA
jgi:hypothetical protein